MELSVSSSAVRTLRICPEVQSVALHHEDPAYRQKRDDRQPIPNAAKGRLYQTSRQIFMISSIDCALP
jgi:hypothetical protein